MFLFDFRKFIAPTVIKALYFIGLIVAVFGGLGVIIYALTEMQALGSRFAMQLIIGAVVGVPVIVMILRFTAEMWLVLFEMNKRLTEMRDRR